MRWNPRLRKDDEFLDFRRTNDEFLGLLRDDCVVSLGKARAYPKSAFRKDEFVDPLSAYSVTRLSVYPVKSLLFGSAELNEK